MQSSDVYIEDDTCVYPSSPALALGFISAIFAIITRIYISVTFGGCSCCRKDDSYSTMIPKILYILSWYQEATLFFSICHDMIIVKHANIRLINVLC